MNAKILERKTAIITQTIDQDGGCTLIEALGLLEYIKLQLMELAKTGFSATPKDAKKEYDALKTRRIGRLN